MKKNLRIVSAAAAALLAVAPIASVAAANVAPTIVSASRIASSKTALDLRNDFENHLNVHSTSTLPGGVTLSHAESNWKITRGNSSTNLNHVRGHLWAGRYTVTADVTVTISAAQTTPVHVSANATGVAADAVTADIPANSTSVVLHNVKFVETLPEAPVEGAYWVRRDGGDFANNTTVAANNDQNNYMFNGNGRNEISAKDFTLAHIENAIKNVVELRNSRGQALNFNDNVDAGTGANALYRTLARQLRTANITVHAGRTVNSAHPDTALNASNIDTADRNSYIDPSTVSALTFTITAKSGAKVTVTFANSYRVDTVSPVVYGKYGNNWEQVLTRGGYVKPILVTENDLGNNTAWNPSDYLRVDPNINTHAWMSGVQYSGNVDLTKAGLYSVEVKATNAAGKSVDLHVPVVVDATNGHLMTVVKTASIYSIDKGVASLTGSAVKTLPVGSQVHVYGSVVTAKLNGTDTQFYRIVSPKGNYYVEASALKDGVVSTTNSQAVSKTINHISAIYDKNGNQTNDSKLTAYNSVQVLPTTVTIKGSKMYQLVENGKPVDKYVKASNIDGTSKTLKHNSYVYTQYGHKVYKKNGKAVKMPKRGKRGSLRKVASGSTVTVYGGALFNKQYYRIGHNQYIKVANFR